MAYHFIDNVHSKSLTPREPNVELLDASCERNIIVCLCNASGKTFIASKLTQHIVNTAQPDKGTVTLYVADSPSVVSRQAACFQRLTDLVVGEYHTEEDFKMKSNWRKSKADRIFLMETQVAVSLLEKEALVMSAISLLILHGCHCVLRPGLVPMKKLMHHYYESPHKPHVLSLASSLFSSNLDLSQMESSLVKMEDVLDCKVETASNVVSVLRYGTHPREAVIEYEPHTFSEIDKLIEKEILGALDFIKDHRYDPCEMYEGFTEELQKIPDPKCDPEEVLLDLLDVLYTLGPWSADRAALVLLLHIEKLKVTTPYERHFLLLCMTSSVLVKIRAILDDFFKDVNEKDRIYKFSSPKILRLIEILKKFQPEKTDAEEYSEEEEEDESKQDLTSIVSDLKRKHFDCECELITQFLQKRLKHPQLKNLTYSEFIGLINNNTKTETRVETSSSNNQNLSTHQSDKSSIEKQNDKNNDNSCGVEQRKLGNVWQKKNGYLCNGSVLNLPPGDGESGERKINEVKTLENYLQYHEYLLLPRFKVDRHARYDRYNVTNQLKGMGQEDFVFRQMKSFGDIDFQLCGLVFIEKKFTAKVLFHVLNDLKQADEDFSFLNVQFSVGKVVDGTKDPKEAENEHRKQELVLKRFRMRVCNLLIGTSFLEEGIDLPKCNLVVRFDLPKDYRSYVNSKERARAADSLYCLLVDASKRDHFIQDLGKYYETEAMLLKKCGNLEPTEEEEKEADQYSQLIQPFCPLLKRDCPYVDLSTAIALVNRSLGVNGLITQLSPTLVEYYKLVFGSRYCAKLPSDTFTRLTPICNVETIDMFGKKMYVCSIRLPINSPVKQEIRGCPMPTRVLARRFAALQCCQVLHSSGELDDTLQPISKETFWTREEEQLTATLEELEEMIPKDSMEPRPGTTKRRQYYYKRIADSLTDCLPVAGKPSYLYDISMALTCPLPEEQNTRGRKIHPPEDSSQGFGILTRKCIPKIGPFPIFTRSGEVQVKLQLAQSTVVLSESQIDKIVAFIHYTFTSVLRLQKYLMMFDPNSSENSYFIVPTKNGNSPGTVEVDWEFLELIFEKRNQVPVFVPEEERKNFVFDATKFEDAVVSPWYRNQDQPQYLYVAEICRHLNPTSEFPGTEYETFEEYYLKKYGIQIQNREQALLDVDHTSARLNFLTPRYVNRKGVALPTTSEEKKRAKRENLKQKQILIPELCDIHPFPGTLWRKAVCLPCILHRINALLLADQVRRMVAAEIGVGTIELEQDFNWKPLNFGWSLADVLKQTKNLQKQAEEEELKKEREKIKLELEKNQEDEEEEEKKEECENEDENKGDSWLEIGTWSNDMASLKGKGGGMDQADGKVPFPKDLEMIKKTDFSEANGWDSEITSDTVRYSSPPEWMEDENVEDDNLSEFLSDTSCSDDYFDDSMDTESEESDTRGLQIEFTEENVAEAVENKKVSTYWKDLKEVEEDEPWCYEETEQYSKFVDEFNTNLEKTKKDIIASDRFFAKDKPFDYTRPEKSTKGQSTSEESSGDSPESTFGNSDNKFPRLVKEIPEDVTKLPHTELILKSLKEEEERRLRAPKEVGSKNGPPPQIPQSFDDDDDICKKFSFDEQPDLEGHPGPSPSLILQALTMSNANDGINLERLETIGDSFLKYAITTYLYCVYENVHEGKLSHLRSKQSTVAGVGIVSDEANGSVTVKGPTEPIHLTLPLASSLTMPTPATVDETSKKVTHPQHEVSNFNLYRLGRRKMLGESMIATKFEPHDNWLPPCYYVPRELERALIEAGVPASHWNRADLPSLRNLSKEEINQLVREKGEKLGIVSSDKGTPNTIVPCLNVENMPCFIPYNLMTQHSIPDKSIADCVEALIGAYLVACGPRGALLFMSWLGIKVLPKEERFFKSKDDAGIKKGVGCSLPVKVTTEEGEVWSQVCFGELQTPTQPLLRHLANPEGKLEQLLRGFDVFEDSLRYRFRDRSYLLQALTHASYSPNRLTDCYQRLEFLGDAVLDYLITRHLYEDSRHHSPGALTDLRSALVNNTIFASLAVRHNFHKYFRHLCPSLNEVVDRFVRIQQENGHSISEEYYLIEEEEEYEEAEDVEVPKALGDVFESVAGAIFLDSGMSLDAVWRVYYRIMKNEIELFSTNVPKSPIRELFELEPETAQFGKPEKLADGRRVRVTVEVFGKGLFSGIGRNYRIAKCTAAKCALKQLKRKGFLERRK